MHCGNGFEILINVVFSIIPKLGGIGPKAQELVIPFWLGEGKYLSNFHLRDLAVRSELVFTRDKTGYINNLKVK